MGSIFFTYFCEKYNIMLLSEALTEVLKGKVVKIMTDALVEVELEIVNVSEKVTTWTEVITPDTRENDWWGQSIDHKKINYIVEFKNGYFKEYSSIDKINLK